MARYIGKIHLDFSSKLAVVDFTSKFACSVYIIKDIYFVHIVEINSVKIYINLNEIIYINLRIEMWNYFFKLSNLILK